MCRIAPLSGHAAARAASAPEAAPKHALLLVLKHGRVFTFTPVLRAQRAHNFAPRAAAVHVSLIGIMLLLPITTLASDVHAVPTTFTSVKKAPSAGNGAHSAFQSENATSNTHETDHAHAFPADLRNIAMPRWSGAAAGLDDGLGRGVPWEIMKILDFSCFFHRFSKKNHGFS